MLARVTAAFRLESVDVMTRSRVCLPGSCVGKLTSTVLCQKGLSDISSFLQERQKCDFKQLSFPLLFGK